MTWKILRGLASRSSSSLMSLMMASILVLDLLALEGGQPAQLHLEDGVGLDLGQLEALDERRSRRIDVRRRADRGDDLVQVVEGDLQALEDVRALLRAREVELRPPADDLAPVGDVVLEHLLEAERLGLAVDERQHVRAEARLKGRVLEELLHDRVRRAVALHLHHDPHAISVAFVANVANVADLLRPDELRHALDQRRLVDLVGQLGDDHRHAPAHLLEGDLAADDDPAASRGVQVPDGIDVVLLAGDRVALVLEAEDRAAGREVGAVDDTRHSSSTVSSGLSISARRRGADLAQVVRAGCWSPCRRRCPTSR